MHRWIALSLSGAFLFAHLGGHAGGQAAWGAGFDRKGKLPPGWTVVESIVASEQQLAAFSKRLGGQVDRVANTTFAVDGQRIKINTIACATAADATKVHELLLRARKNLHAVCAKDNKIVIEFVANDLKLVERAYLAFDFVRPQVTYDVSFQAAPLVRCDYMLWNQMYNAFSAPEPNEQRIRALAKRFAFGDQIWVRAHGLGSTRSSFAFVPEPRIVKRVEDNDLTTHSFDSLPRQFGVPQVAVKAVITAEAYALAPTQRKAGKELLGATSFWPSADPEIVTLAKQITGDKADPADKVAALLGWCASSDNLRFDDRVKGSRYGVLKALQQKFGMCWDFSDCFVTLCRASGVPCRQVQGWLHGQDGHIWAEVLLEGRGWRQVDPTTGMGCDCRYVPLFASESGAAPVVYTSAVRVAPR